jgi:ABC-type phosphate/phosphonate transport system substrate-binding protein
LRDALLSLEPHPGGKAILEQLGYLRFIETTEEDYLPVFDLAGKAGINITTYRFRND